MFFALIIMKATGINIGLIVTILLLPMFCYSSMGILFLMLSYANQHGLKKKKMRSAFSEVGTTIIGVTMVLVSASLLMVGCRQVCFQLLAYCVYCCLLASLVFGVISFSASAFIMGPDDNSVDCVSCCTAICGEGDSEDEEAAPRRK